MVQLVSNKAKKGLKNEHFLTPDPHMQVCISGIKKCSFFRKLGLPCFLVTPVGRFTLLSYYQQVALSYYLLLCLVAIQDEQKKLEISVRNDKKIKC